MTKSPRAILRLILLTLLVCHSVCRAEKPNIVVILADDLGYGDVACFNPNSKIPTPNLDKLAQQGMRFTDAHSASTVCTPSRYGLLTGRMCFRTGMRGVFTGVDGPLIRKGQPTIAAMLKRQGYRTACIGKWHVGMTFFNKEGKPVKHRGGGLKKVREVDFSRSIRNGPTDLGFDYFFGTVCCPTTDWLYAYIRNDRVVQAPTELVKPKTANWLKYGYFRTGLKSPDFEFRKVDLVFLEESKRFLKEHLAKNSHKPFFLYHATQTAHLPSLPDERFVGKTKIGPHGDFVFEFDYVVGELMKTLEELGVAKNTLVVVTSDNGPEIVTANLREKYGHDSAGGWRGFKRDNWEGGHRIPTIVRWPGTIEASSVSHQTICLTDWYATFASILQVELKPVEAQDSTNILPALLGQATAKPIREFTLHQTISNALAIRKGPWKYLNHKGSGGNHYRRTPLIRKYYIPDTSPKARGQLYHLKNDPGETQNLVEKYPEVAAELKRLLDESKNSRSASSKK